MKATPSGEPFVIFIIDDDDGIIPGLLRSHGYETQSFTSSEEFLEKHDRSLPGCALLDLSMAGLELQQTLARNDGARRPIVFLTGRADILSSVRAMKAGAVDILTKPVEGGALLAAIAQAEQLGADLRRESAELSCIEERGAVDLPVDHRRIWRTHLGVEQFRARRDVPVQPAVDHP